MIENLLNTLSKTTLYVTFSGDRMTVRHVQSGRAFADKPILAMKKNRKGKDIVAGVGADAEKLKQADANITLSNGFHHPRICINDFDVAEATLSLFIRKAIGRLPFVRPIIILHPMEEFEGGLSFIEMRVLKELGEASGARKTYIWVGRKLKDREILALDFPESEGTLETF